MSGVTAMPHKTEAQWAVEADARTLVDAEIIRSDTKRFKAAAAYQQKVNEAGKEAMKK